MLVLKIGYFAKKDFEIPLAPDTIDSVKSLPFSSARVSEQELNG